MFNDINYQPKANEIKTSSGAVFKKMPALIPQILDVYFAKRKIAKRNKKQCL